MKTLIVDDDFTSRFLLQELLRPYGPTATAVDGEEAVFAAQLALDAHDAYDLICLDIMMPEMDGREALKGIREQEESRGVQSSRGSKIVMTTAVDDLTAIMASFYDLCDGYLVKPIAKAKLIEELHKLALIP